MNSYKRLLIVLAAASLLTGCAGMEGWRTKPEGKYVPAIDAASAMEGPDQRTELMVDIASQPDLSEPEQMYLIDAVVKARCSEPIRDALTHRKRMASADATRILLALLKNPAVTQNTKQKVSNVLPKLSLSEEDIASIARAQLETSKP